MSNIRATQLPTTITAKPLPPVTAKFKAVKHSRTAALIVISTLPGYRVCSRQQAYYIREIICLNASHEASQKCTNAQMHKCTNAQMNKAEGY